ASVEGTHAVGHRPATSLKTARRRRCRGRGRGRSCEQSGGSGMDSDATRRSGYAPVVLGPNQPDGRPYLGGAGIARFRGTAQPSPHSPEDFVASTTEVFAGGGVGLTILPDGRRLRDAVIADPIGFLGEEHVRRF